MLPTRRTLRLQLLRGSLRPSSSLRKSKLLKPLLAFGLTLHLSRVGLSRLFWLAHLVAACSSCAKKKLRVSLLRRRTGHHRL